MKKTRCAKILVIGLVSCAVLGCGAAPSGDRVVDMDKIPISTSSDEALDAFLKGQWLFENLRVTDAHRYFLKAVEADPEFALAHLRVANTAPTNSEFFQAFQRAVETSENASEGERHLIAAFEAAVAGEPEVQLAKLDALVTLFPKDERAHNALGDFLFFNQQDYERAIAVYRQAIELNPDFAPPYNMLGYALRFIGDYTAAEEAFKRYAELIPDQPNPYDSYAELLMKMGRYEESIASYEKALAIDPNFFASYIGIGNNQMFMDRFDDARTAFAKIQEIARNDAERRQAHTWIAASYIHQRDFESALQEIQKRYDIAAETDDRAALAADLNLMGNILLHVGKAHEAAEKFAAQIEMIQSSDATEEVREVAARNQIYDLARVALWRGDLDSAAELAEEYRDAVKVHNVRFETQRSHELYAMIAAARNEILESAHDLETRLVADHLADKQVLVVYHPYPVPIDALFAALEPWLGGE